MAALTPLALYWARLTACLVSAGFLERLEHVGQPIKSFSSLE